MEGDTYLTPAVSEELVGHDRVLSVHYWGDPVTPYPPLLDVLCFDQVNGKNDELLI